MFSQKTISKIELLLLLVLLIFAGLTHGINMFKYPYYENDEGTYMSQAWSVLEDGKLAPYTYWYDHAPAGWILIALWVKITGGFFTFGTSVNSGRVMMLVIHLAVSVLLFYIGKRITGKVIASTMAILIFSLSPLGIYFQRRVLLDNIMIFWVLLSLALLLKRRLKLTIVIMSALVMGIAVLTKENAIFFAPIFLYILSFRTHDHNRKIAIFSWSIVTGSIISTYFLYALLKNEFFPAGFMGDTSKHVSLISTLIEQMGRGKQLPFWSTESDFYQSFFGWLTRDRFTIGAGLLSTVLGLIFSIRVKMLRIPTFLSVLFWLFLVRGKLVLDFYIVPLLPILTLNIGIVVDWLIDKIREVRPIVYIPMVGLIITAGIATPLSEDKKHYFNDETSPQVQMIDWVKNNLDENTHMVIDDSIFVDLHAPRYEGDKVFPNADWAWKVEKDNEIFANKLGNQWSNIQYLGLSHEILKQVRDTKFTFIKRALDNSEEIVRWDEKSNAFVDVGKYISTNGDWMAIYKVKDKKWLTLDQAWYYYKNNFIVSYGQVIDPQQNDRTTSEGQSYAMLRAVWQNDKITFDGVWNWTVDHFQHRTQDKLFSWLWLKQDNGEYKLGDSGSATDADEDIALALILAYRRWGEDSYLEEAKNILDDIWAKEVITAGNRLLLVSGSDAERNGQYLVNPSYFSPGSYRVFAEIDKSHDWNKLADDVYYWLEVIGVPPNWILIDKKGVMRSALESAGADADYYGFDSFRINFRVLLDDMWHEEPKAKIFLQKMADFYNRLDEIKSIYDLSGKPMVDYSAMSTTTGAIMSWLAVDKEKAVEFYSDKIQKQFNLNEGYWGDKKNYYDQNWAWFTAAAMTGDLPSY